MPDCWLKYYIIVERSKAGMNKFKDVQFPAGDESIGESLITEGSFKPGELQWVCFSDEEGAKIGRQT